jgi:hypothetical protein
MSAPRLRTAIGAYQQADLEAMDTARLRTVRDWAARRLNQRLDRLAVAIDPTNEDAAAVYFELLAGAAEGLLLAREEAAGPEDYHTRCQRTGRGAQHFSDGGRRPDWGDR